ncbi:MAG TPA: hypothetical protein VEW42_03190 [Candidatus Eisenbacteria bacterium]|nr:hypothetical protein [Candidatus Eisenbacteria bacterium]
MVEGIRIGFDGGRAAGRHSVLSHPDGQRGLQSYVAHGTKRSSRVVELTPHDNRYHIYSIVEDGRWDSDRAIASVIVPGITPDNERPASPMVLLDNAVVFIASTGGKVRLNGGITVKRAQITPRIPEEDE